MEYQPFFSDLSHEIKPSFIREILSEALSPGVISFAGGLPKDESFPVAGLKAACDWVIEHKGSRAFQYAETEGDIELRKWISARYAQTKGINVDHNDILITTGSQQAMDLLSRVLITPGDAIVTESPGYLGALQVFAINGAHMLGVRVNETGMDAEMLEHRLERERAKFIYCTPNFQNPTGISYSEEARKSIADIAVRKGTLIVEDNPYEDLAFVHRKRASFAQYAPDNTILLGSFSKSVAPGLRLGWVVAPRPIHRKMVALKQASDLHSSSFTQYVVCRYLQAEDAQQRLAFLAGAYAPNKDAMVAAVRQHLGNEVRFSEPEGGMFLWLEWLNGMDTERLFRQCLGHNVIFVPGKYFYVGEPVNNTARLSFSCVTPEQIETGIRAIAQAQSSLRL